jgi:hypothetical protein
MVVECNTSTGMIGNDTVLHSSMDLLKVEPDSCDGSEVIDVKVEEVTIKEAVTIKEEDFSVVKEEEDPLLIRLPLTEVEHEVSCISMCSLLSHISQMSRNAL